MNFATFDLNLLRVFMAMMVELSTVRAGERLRLSQPAVSSALRRLREATGDDLFVRDGNHMAPTPRALQLRGPIEEALRRMEEALNAVVGFDPAAATNDFVMAGSDYVSTLLLPRLVEATASEAPGVGLQLLDVRPSGLFAALSDGRVVIGIERLLDTPEWIGHARLHRSFAVCVARRRNSLLATSGVKPGARIPPHIYCAIPAVILSTDGSRAGSFGPALKQLGLKRDVRVTAPHFHAVAHIAAESDLLGSLPIHLARKLSGPLKLDLYLPPFEPPLTEMHLYWHRRFDGDPAHEWLRSLACRVLDFDEELSMALPGLFTVPVTGRS